MISVFSRFARMGIPGGLIVMALFSALFWSASASAQESYELGLIEDRLKVLERQMEGVERSIAGANAANTGVRLDQLEIELRRLTGKVEEMRFALDGMEREMKRFRRNTDDRLTILEGGEPAIDAAGDDPMAALVPEADQDVTPISPDRAAATGTLGTVPQSALPPNPDEAALDGGGTLARAPALPSDISTGVRSTAPVTGAARADYRAAIGLIRKRQYAEAGNAFEQIIRRYPNDPLAGKAQYWLGQTYFSRGQYEEAANAYLDGYRNYPDGSTAPDSLLKLGMTLERLGQPDEACLTYQEVERKYPRASTTVKRRTASEKAKIGCR